MERWLPAPGYEGLYSVSDWGRVRIEVRRQNIRKGAFLTQSPQRDGYLHVAFRRDNEVTPKGHSVARLVLRTFVGGPEKGMQANHRDGDITNNRLDNLEWVTPRENTRHSIEALGRSRGGEHNPASKLTERQVVALRERAARGWNYPRLAKRFGITTVMAGQIARGLAWPDAGGPKIEGRPLGRPPRKRRESS